MSNNLYGDLAEVKVHADLISKGFKISVPSSEISYDLVAEKNMEFYSVQVKKGSARKDCTDGSMKCSIQKSGRDVSTGKRKYKSEDFDILAMWVKEWDNVAYKVWEEPTRTWTIRKKSESEKNQGSHRHNYIEDYTIDRAIETLK